MSLSAIFNEVHCVCRTWPVIKVQVGTDRGDGRGVCAAFVEKSSYLLKHIRQESLHVRKLMSFCEMSARCQSKLIHNECIIAMHS